ncbi:MAG: hypothetical protein KGL39_05395 [Patescibacteria group bacterium]|nr:hypothetical protein [Patescibacteria group bacterium]
MAVTDASITTTTAASFVPEIWSDEALEAVEFAAVIQKRVNTDYQSDMTIGNTYLIPRLSNLTTQTKSAGVANTIDFEAITESQQSVTIATHEYAAFLLENVVAVQANQDLRAKYSKKIGYALTRGREVNLAGLAASFSTYTVGTLGIELTSDDYLQVWQNFASAGLFGDGTDPDADFSLFVSPAAYAAQLKVDLFTNRDYKGDGAAIERAEVGDIYGMPSYLSNLLTSPAGGQHDCMAIHREGVCLIVQKEVPVVSQYLIRYLADGVAGWNLYGYADVSFPPETPGGGTAVDNRCQWLKTV